MSLMCRLCGINKDASDIACELNDIKDGTLTMKDFVEFYCRISLNNDKKYSQKICRNCRLQLELFITFRENIGKVQIKMKLLQKNSMEKKKNENEAALEIISSDDEQTLEAATSKKGSSTVQIKQSRTARISSLSIRDLLHDSFDTDMGVFDLDHFSHISVEYGHVADDGEVNRNWLRSFGAENDTWMHFVYNCTHCSQLFKSFSALLHHLMPMPKALFKIKCPQCNQISKATNSYINHSAKNHFAHLAFTCICCSKLFYNTLMLIKHYMHVHPTVFQMFPCIECGHYCSSLATLKAHMMRHRTREAEAESYDEDSDNCEEDQGKSAQCNKFNGMGTDKRKKIVQPSSESDDPFIGCYNAGISKNSHVIKTSSLKPSVANAKNAMKFLPKSPPKRKADAVDPPIARDEEAFTNKKKRCETNNAICDQASERTTYQCNKCNRILMTHLGLQYHQLTHSDGKPFSCTKCSMAFRTRNTLQAHEEEMHA